MHVVVNAMAAIALTHRFDPSGKGSRYVYLRGYACDRMTDATLSLLEASPDPNARLIEAKKAIGTAIRATQAQMENEFDTYIDVLLSAGAGAAKEQGQLILA